MARFRPLAVTALSCVLASCAIHPLPEDVTGLTTYEIVRQIRCEAREAVVELAIGWLTADENLKDGKVDPASRRIGIEFAEHARPIQTFSPKLFKGRVNKILTVFYDSGIAYNFNLTMTENNNIDPTIDLLKPMSNGGKFTVGVTANADRQRQNVRIFTITDTFSGLVQKIPDDYCTGKIVRENYIYPIAGKIGIEKMIEDFIRLTLFADLSGTSSGGKVSGPPTMSDTLEFTTTFSISATPKVTFAQIGNALQFADASLNATAKRVDDHKVTVGLALGNVGAAQVSSVRSSLMGPLLTVARVTGPEQAAAEAVNQALTLQVFKPTIVVSPSP